MYKIWIFTLLVSAVCTSCIHSTSPIDPFFDTLEKKIDQEKLRAYQNAPKDSSMHYLLTFETDFFRIYHDSSQQDRLRDFFRDIYDGQDTGKQVLFLNFAFHSRLNEGRFNTTQTLQDVADEIWKNNKAHFAEIAAQQEENRAIMHKNEVEHQVGNAINIILPVTKYNAGYHHNFLDRFDYSGFDDSLAIQGILLRKTYFPHFDAGKTDTIGITFTMKILQMSASNYTILGNKYHIGDSLDICLEAYGRPVL